MNKVILIGRLVADPELRSTPSGSSVCSYRLAVDRPFAKDGDQTADFINVVSWGKAADNVAKYMRKGRQVAVEGRMQTRDYDDKDGVHRWVTEIVTDRVEFIGSKSDDGAQKPAKQQKLTDTDFGEEVSFSDEDLPF